jgi:hypothetical protein
MPVAHKNNNQGDESHHGCDKTHGTEIAVRRVTYIFLRSLP